MAVVYEVRLENGASVGVGDCYGFGAAVDLAVESLLGCMPKGTQKNQIVAPTIVRRVDQRFCALCGGKQTEQRRMVEANPASGAAVMICTQCVVSVSCTARALSQEVYGAFKR